MDKLTVLLPDGHVPYHSKPHLRSVDKYLAANHVDNLVFMGDWWDCDEISRFVMGKPRQTEGKRIVKSAGQCHDVLARLTASARKINPKCKVYYLEGNHEARTHDYLDRYPVLDGLIDIAGLLGLDALGIQFVPSWSESEILQIGDFCVIHGWFCPKYHTQKHVMELNATVYTGHTHDIQETSIPRMDGPPTVGKSTGCLCDLRQAYRKGRPSKWRNAFTVIKHGAWGHQEFTVKLRSNGTFWGPDGKEYKA